ncbi:MAG: YihY/virulence factor BrkB family protein [Candidatus Cloacimonetes bacterium]|nr:YihY/virulence factor BrkB family protein [Candidatus Cloacimonadota bacterium]
MNDNGKKGFFANLWALIVTYVKAVWIDLVKLRSYLTEPAKRRQVLSDLWDFLKRWFRLIIRERVMREAGSLTYITILGFVPFVVFLLLIVPDLPFLNLQEKVFNLISNNLMPTSALAVNNVIEGMLEGRAGFNIINFVVMIISSYSLFRTIRDSFDRILKMEYHPKQDLLSQVIKFLGTIILGVFILVVLISSSSLPLISRLLRMPMLRWLTYLVPFVLQFLLLVFLYMLMPSIKVQRMSLVRGAFWTALIWMVVKSGFDTYILRMTSYQKFYGTLSALPIFLLWIYVNWLIVLSGIVMVAVFENKKRGEEPPNGSKEMIRLTLEIYGDGKMRRNLDRYISRNELKEILDPPEEEEEG